MGIAVRSVILLFGSAIAFAGGCTAIPSEARQTVSTTSEMDTVQYYDGAFDDPEALAAIVRQFVLVRASADPERGLVILRGSPAAVRTGAELIDHLKLDFDDGPGTFRRTFIRRLQHGRATDVAELLQELIDHGAFGTAPKAWDQPLPKVAADDGANTVIIECEPGEEIVMRKIMDELDQPVGEEARK